ncbi:DNA primase large subunit [Haemorhous mexicanus]|uniref:DNA primase large subunit n=1 Tax=Haemorhous mexicanus TaxID=30427 RepID=UPI0028BE9E73|nr:DNA primase large subunit [Haemorhous mexicanus]
MEFSSRARQRHARLAGDRREQYPHSLQFYLEPPTESISLVEFESFAVDRLRLLKVIENLGVSYVRSSDAYKVKLEAELRKLKFPYRALAEDDYEARRKDHISHFILRLAYCQSEDLRRWFLQQEMDLFRYRFSQLTESLMQKFLEHVNLSFEAIGEDLKNQLANELSVSTPGFSLPKVKEQMFYKVGLADAVDLFRARRVFIKDGFAFVPFKEIDVIVLNNYRTKLSKALALTARSLPSIQSDERLQPLLNHLSHSYVGPDYSVQKNAGKISLEQIDALSVKSFPLCMRQLHRALRESHHLRHGGRMQYGLFLKGIGLTLEQALEFWKKEFIRGKVDADKFDKGYAYSIRHSYGKEGKRTDYTPYSCMKIIMSNPPSQGDYHGCPFRHSDPELLKQKLQSYKIPPSGIAQVLELVKGMHFQLACQKYFELTHDVEDIGFSLNHPNQYFTESQKLLNGGREPKKEFNNPGNFQQKNNSQESITSSSTPTPSNAKADTELEGLEAYFTED